MGLRIDDVASDLRKGSRGDGSHLARVDVTLAQIGRVRSWVRPIDATLPTRPPEQSPAAEGPLAALPFRPPAGGSGGSRRPVTKHRRSPGNSPRVRPLSRERWTIRV